MKCSVNSLFAVFLYNTTIYRLVWNLEGIRQHICWRLRLFFCCFFFFFFFNIVWISSQQNTFMDEKKSATQTPPKKNNREWTQMLRKGKQFLFLTKYGSWHEQVNLNVENSNYIGYRYLSANIKFKPKWWRFRTMNWCETKICVHHLDLEYNELAWTKKAFVNIGFRAEFYFHVTILSYKDRDKSFFPYFSCQRNGNRLKKPTTLATLIVSLFFVFFIQTKISYLVFTTYFCDNLNKVWLESHIHYKFWEQKKKKEKKTKGLNR